MEKHPKDRIMVRDYVREVEIGAFQQERGHLQRVRFTVVLEVAPHDAAADDDVDKVLSYDTIVEAIEAQLTQERINLLETLAERVAERCLEDRRASRAHVRIEKLDRIPGTLGVEIVRERGATHAKSQALDIPHPRVVYLDNAVLYGDALKDWLKRAEDGPALIICVGPVPGARPEAAHKLAQRRVDLLSMEQNAWVLAGQDARCVVVDSRTELDWAMKHGQICVWAPSKLVLDAVDSPQDLAPEALALWFADRFEAAELWIVGGGDPGQGATPVQRFEATP
ncbi:dihydroneopterin aldolase [Paracoccaceae bacterium GXU_MW_L88]